MINLLLSRLHFLQRWRQLSTRRISVCHSIVRESLAFSAPRVYNCHEIFRVPTEPHRKILWRSIRADTRGACVCTLSKPRAARLHSRKECGYREEIFVRSVISSSDNDREISIGEGGAPRSRARGDIFICLLCVRKRDT